MAAPAGADPNLLSVANGTILRSYSPVSLDHIGDGDLGNAAEGFGTEISADSKPPFVFTFELPEPRRSTSRRPCAARNTARRRPTPDFAVSTTGPDARLQRRRNYYAQLRTDETVTLAANVDARWARVTANAPFDSVRRAGRARACTGTSRPHGHLRREAV